MTWKHREFENGAAAILRLLGHANTYVCPICLSSFGPSSIDERTLTEEHVPPESVGGKRLVLTCKECNNKAGSTSDAEVHRRHELFRFARALGGQGDYRGCLRLRMGPSRTNVEAEIGGREVRMTAIPKINNPTEREKLFNHLEFLREHDKWDGHTFNITPQVRYNARVASVGDLKSAYLAAFATFGYRYILTPALDGIRAQIRRPKEKIIDYFCCGTNGEIGSQLMVRSVKYPFKALAIQIESRLIFLPYPGATTDLYGNLLSAVRSVRAKGNIGGHEYGWPSVAAY